MAMVVVLTDYINQSIQLNLAHGNWAIATLTEEATAWGKTLLKGVVLVISSSILLYNYVIPFKKPISFVSW